LTAIRTYQLNFLF